MSLIIQLGVLILVSSLLAVFFRFIKQPPLIAYLLVGGFLSIFSLSIISDEVTLKFASELAIVLLLFLAGLEVKFRKNVNALILGVSQILITSAVLFFAVRQLYEFNNLITLYIALGLTLSSTILVIKTLADRKELDTFHGKLLTGLMIVQDFIAVIAIGILTTIGLDMSFGENISAISFMILKGAGVFLFMYLLGKYILPKVFQKASESVELVFIVGLGWMFFGVLLAFALNFSIAVGSFIAGISIATLPFAFEIKDRTQGLRDFSLILFFSTLGTQLLLTKELFLSTTTLLLAAISIILSPLIIAFITSFFGFDKKKIFIISLLPNQVSEFSFIIIMIGLQLGHIGNNVLSIITTIAIITIIVSSVLSYNINPVFRKLEVLYRIFEWRRIKSSEKEWSRHVVIFGLGDLGAKLASYFKKENVVFVDNDPEKLEIAKGLHSEMIYGDISTSDVWYRAHLDKAKIFINTVGNDLETDLKIADWLKERNKRIVKVTETDNSDFKKILKKHFNFVLHKEEAKWDKLKGYLKWN